MSAVPPVVHDGYPHDERCTALQIDEFLKTGTFEELESSGGVQKTTPPGEAPEGDAKMALNFL